jgi:hypothetical protein
MFGELWKITGQRKGRDGTRDVVAIELFKRVDSAA